MSLTKMRHTLIMHGFDNMLDYNEFMKSAIEREQKLTSGRLEEGAKGLDTKEREEYFEFFSEDYLKIEDIFGKLALNYFVVMLYAHIEAGMGNLCDTLRYDRQKKGEKIDLRYSDLRGCGYLDQAKLYMEKVLGVDLDLGRNAQWPEIVGLRTLRNAIVHNEGLLNTKDETLKKYIANGFIELNPLLKKDEGNGEVSGYVRVKSEYIDYILRQAQKFFQDVKITNS